MIKLGYLTLFSESNWQTSFIQNFLSLTLNWFHSLANAKIEFLVTPGRIKSLVNGGVINSFSEIITYL